MSAEPVQSGTMSMHTNTIAGTAPAVLNSAGLLELLYSRAKTSMSGQELQQVADSAAEVAERTAQQQARLMETLGCLVREDAHEPAGVGNFRDPAETADLLFMLQGQFDLIAGMVHLSQEAGFMAAQRG